MFTGLVEEIGKIGTITPIAGGKRIEVLCKLILEDINVNDSIAIDGVCLTATEVMPNGFRADAVGETLSKTSLNWIKTDQEVNLERALRWSDRLGGHLVQGHVNGIATISRITRLGENYMLEIRIPDSLQKYVINEGSIAVNGISLTIAKLSGINVSFSIIPHTWNHTILRKLSIGDRVNIETDVIAKYIERLMMTRHRKNDQEISENWLKNMGY